MAQTGATSPPPTPPATGGLQGAAAILQNIDAARESARSRASLAAAAAPEKPDPFAAMRQQIQEFDKARASLAPGAAAHAWLGLVDRYFAFLDAGGSQITVQSPPGAKPETAPTFRDVLLVLPPPASWPQLLKEVDARPLPASHQATGSKAEHVAGYSRPVVAKCVRLIALRLTVHTLTRHSELQWQDFDSLRRLAAAVKAEKGTDQGASETSAADEISGNFANLIEALLKTAPDPKRAVAMITLELDLEEAANTRNQQDSPGRNGQVSVLSLPDLVPLVGEQQSAVLIRKAVRQNSQIRVEKGIATEHLACRIATAEVAHLRMPQWALVSGFDADSMALMTAMRTRFSLFASARSDNQDYQTTESRKAALGFYLYGLCVEGKMDEAVRLAKLLPNQESPITGPALAAAKKAGLSAVAYNFLSRVIAATSNYELYNALLEIAPNLNRSSEVLREINKALAQPNLAASERKVLDNALIGVLLASDRVDEAVGKIRAQLKTEMSLLQHHAGEGAVAANGTSQAEILELDNRLVTLGALAGHDDWVAEGVRSATDRLQAEASSDANTSPNSAAAMASEPGIDSLYYTVVQLAAKLEETGRFSEAEEILSLGLRRAVIRSAITAENQKRQQNYVDFSALQPQSSETSESAYLSALVLLYSHAGRTADVLALLDGAPGWGNTDLIDVPGFSYGKNTLLGVAAAQALLSAGRADEARRVVMAFLKSDPGTDALYALLLKIDGPEPVLSTLDTLAKQDRFEERPLIWRAEALLMLGRLPEAETAARAAIAIDPSDGEEPHGDRMRAYDVLSRIRAARGDQAESAFFASVVTAIRTAEHADDLYQAGLLSRGISLYQDALTHFADAYCIQSRLAVDLASAGKMEEAMAHYRRAYELMPASFGRLESHCFGCEGAFLGATPQKIAEQVFTSLIAKEPKKPQVYYLLGYLREEENRPAEALTEFRRAAALDPDYINAWRHISDLASAETAFDPSRDAAAMNLLRLDPSQKHITIDLASVSDLGGLYTLVANLQRDDLLASNDGSALPLWSRGFRQATSHPAVYGLAAAKAQLERNKVEMLEAIRKQGNPNAEQYLEQMQGNISDSFADSTGPVTSPMIAVSRNAILALVPGLFDGTTLSPTQ